MGGKSYEEQLQLKSALIDVPVKPRVHSVGQERLRDRAELVWVGRGGDRPQLGLYALGTRDIVDLEACPMMTEGLEAWLQEYRQLAPPIKLGTVRLRVAPNGQKGAWLDFSNVDVKTLFEERTYLEWLSSRAIVEIGQRRKRFVWKDGVPKLVDPELFPWFETVGRGGRVLPVYGVIGGFTQVGFRSNRVLVEQVATAVEKTGLREWAELFCGSGNFSLALADRGFKIWAYESDEISLEALKRSKAELEISELEILQADVYHQPRKIGSLQGKGLLVDPPRSGLGKFLDWLESLNENERPSALVYVSCFTDSFNRDVQRLSALGFKVEALEAVDQFPHSEHFEWVGTMVSTNPPA